MHVIDTAPNEWTLLRDGDDYFIEVITGISHLAMAMVVKLLEDEVELITS